jgi:signal transduction histidine kinase
MMRRFRDYSITEKLTWMNILVSAVVLLLAFAGYSIWDMTEFRQGMVRRLSIEAQIIGANSVSALLFSDQTSAENTLAALKAAPHITYAGIYTPGGRLFAGYWRERRDVGAALVAAQQETTLPTNLAGRPEAHWFKDGQLVVMQSIAFQGQRPGVVLIRGDLGEINLRLKQYALIGAVVFGLCSAAVLLLSLFLRRGIADPIVRLADTARLVSRDKVYAARVPGTGARDEIGTLTQAFNEMLEQIETRDAALQDARDELEQRVEQRTAQLSAVNKELEAFSYSVSHDLRAPLRHIEGFVGIFVQEYGSQLDSTAQQYLDRVRSGAKTMGQLIEALLNMGRLSRQETVYRPTDLTALVEDARGELGPECDGRQIEWQIGTLPSVECDPRLIKQVFINLLANAVKYTRKRERAAIQVDQIATEDGAPAIFVRDNGAGFDQRYASRLFGVFQRLHRSEEFEGSGVGLATVQRIINKHGGRIWAEAQVDKGATFFFTLGGIGKAAERRSEPPAVTARDQGYDGGRLVSEGYQSIAPEES